MSSIRRSDQPSAVSNNPIPSSSPAFGTPAHPILPRKVAPIRAPAVLKPAPKSTVLPILLPPATLRPLAFRTFTKKHNLTLTSSALQALATFIGRQCGSGWREEGLAEKVLEEVAKSWKKCSSQVIVEGDGETLKNILKALEGSMIGGRIVLSRQSSFNFAGDAAPQNIGGALERPAFESQTSFGMSSLEVEDKEEEDELLKDPREWFKIVGAFDQPKLVYNVTQRHFDKSSSKPTLFPDPSHKTELFRQRYHIVHQRILRNETFQTPTFSSARLASLNRTESTSTSQTNSITPIANLLGRSGSTHLLLAMLTVSPTGALSLSDLTGTIALDLQHARPVPDDGSYFAPGMIVLVDGSYEEDYKNLTSGSASTLGGTGGIGGTIGGKFIGFSVGHPPCERRSTTLGGDDQDKTSTSGPAFGWTDFLGLGSERATGARMSRIASKIMHPTSSHNVVIASDLHLDIPSTLSALRTLLRTYTPAPSDLHPNYPHAIILMGNFSSKATLAGVPGAGSLEYKEHFDALASVLSEFQQLIAHTTLVFVPGDNDAWPSAFSAGASVILPQKPVPAIFTNRIRRIVAEANREVWGTMPGKKGGKEGEVIWTSNPSRLSWFGVKGEMAIVRDDVMGRLQRTSIRFGKSEEEEEQPQDGEAMPDASSLMVEDSQAMDVDLPKPSNSAIDTDTQFARALTRTLLSQSHLSPFPLSVRPVHWDFAHSLLLYPLPNAVVLADSQAPSFVLKYCGCTVLNPGAIDESGGRGKREGRAKWVEYDVSSGVGVVRVEE
ncbi:DNA polymerase epsilon subunit B [Polyplosphaeria fusca]|uniref:DNA polymerase epsilon subunit B n=1 Tax=Polyplosphaeria fusca TaxID=682080 RepID=A0A9P4V3W4_9PLEO|nr:DNA polymerase epsilon subunit B [Polyplosphaeria fusca]